MIDFSEKAPVYRDALGELKEILLANVVMASEIPSPTGDEEELVKFLCDRFTESDLHNISLDEAGNAAAVLQGNSSSHNILVAAHVDKIWPASDDHTLSVTEDSMSGLGVADNSLGVAVLATLPHILETLKIELNSNLILLGTTNSFGRGDLGGMRFFLDNTKLNIDYGLCLEGMNLGRLSYSSLGMVRGEITVNLNREKNPLWKGAGAIGPLNKIIDSITGIDRPEKPRTSILLGSVRSGSGFNVPPLSGVLRFEVRSESESVVHRIHHQITEIVEETIAQEDCDVELSIVARRNPGDIGFQHPLVKATRNTLEALDVKPRIAPSISELSALLDRGIPALTLGITTGENHSTPEEKISISNIFSGVAQIVATLEYMDQALES